LELLNRDAAVFDLGMRFVLNSYPD